MKSIRSQLLLWLVPSFVIIAFLAGSSLYLSEKRRLEANLDNELNEFVRIMKLTLKRPSPPFAGPFNMAPEFVSSVKKKLSDDSSGYYMQSWAEDGGTLHRSLSLGDQQITHPNQLNLQLQDSSEYVEYDSRLMSGDEIRVYAFSLQGNPRRATSDVSVAISKKGINQRLANFALELTVGGMFFCLLLSTILVLVIRRALIPIQNLTEQVAKVEAGSLHNRLLEENVPTEITPLVDRLNQLLTRLEQSFMRERQFNGDLAHELQTPLAAIRTTSEVALKWPEQSSFDDYRYIAESTIQLQQTIDSLLTLARIESSGNETLSESVNVFTIVEECLSLHANSIEARGIAIILDVNRAQSLRSDPRLLRIILSNLLSNAADYAPENSEVTITGDLLLNNQNTSKHQLNSTVLTVTNSAPNLTKSDLATMFDRLWRKDSSRTGSKHVGLGLSIARTAAKALSLELTADLVEQSTPEQKIKMSLTVVDKKF